MSKITCVYHPDREANLTCEDCNKPICLECERTFRIRHSGNDHHRGYVEKYRICPLCNNERIQKQTIFGPVFMMIFGLVFAGFPVGMMSMIGGSLPPFIYLFLSIFIIAGLGVFGGGIKALHDLPQQKQKSEQETQAFLMNVHQTHGKHPELPRTIVVSKQEGFFCQQCGNKVSLDALFCPNCGDPTTDERELLEMK